MKKLMLITVIAGIIGSNVYAQGHDSTVEVKKEQKQEQKKESVQKKKQVKVCMPCMVQCKACKDDIVKTIMDIADVVKESKAYQRWKKSWIKSAIKEIAEQDSQERMMNRWGATPSKNTESVTVGKKSWINYVVKAITEIVEQDTQERLMNRWPK